MNLIKFHSLYVEEKPSDQLTLTIKNYMTRDGLSRRIIQDKQIYDSTEGVLSSPEYVVKGPMGKGLDIQPSGVHIAFTAGTGVLPFLDLVAYLIRLNLGLVVDDNLGEPDDSESFNSGESSNGKEEGR